MSKSNSTLRRAKAALKRLHEASCNTTVEGWTVADFLRPMEILRSDPQVGCDASAIGDSDTADPDVNAAVWVSLVLWMGERSVQLIRGSISEAAAMVDGATGLAKRYLSEEYHDRKCAHSVIHEAQRRLGLASVAAFRSNLARVQGRIGRAHDFASCTRDLSDIDSVIDAAHGASRESVVWPLSPSAVDAFGVRARVLDLAASLSRDASQPFRALDQLREAADLDAAATRQARRITAALEDSTWPPLSESRKLMAEAGRDSAYLQADLLDGFTFQGWMKDWRAGLQLQARYLDGPDARIRKTRRAIQRSLILDSAGDLEGAREAANNAVAECASLREVGEPDDQLFMLALLNILDLDSKAGEFGMLDDNLASARRIVKGQTLDEARLFWIEGRARCARGDVGGVESFYAARRLFLGQGAAFDAALVNLEMATLAVERGDSLGARTLAGECLPIFQSAGVTAEVIAALALFQHLSSCDALKAAPLRDLAHKLAQSRQS